MRSETGLIYVAPVLVFHYVVEHGYAPPHDFVESVLERRFLGPPEVGLWA